MFDTVGARERGGPFVPKDASRNAWETHTREFTDLKTMERRMFVAHYLNRSEARLGISANGELLSVESSLPKLVHGNNLQTVCDPTPALKRLQEFVADHVDGPIPSIGEMPFARIDYCHNFQVGASLPDYVSTMSQIPFLKHRAAIDGYDGVEWWGKNGRRVRVYDKYHEILEKDKRRAPEARGVLRFEVEIRRKARLLQRRLKKKHVTLSEVLDPRRAYVTLTETLNRMCLDHRFLPLDKARIVIDERFRARKATMLLGFLRRLESQCIDQVKMSFPPSSFYLLRRELCELGLWPPATGNAELPSLELPPFEELVGKAPEVCRDSR